MHNVQYAQGNLLKRILFLILANAYSYHCVVNLEFSVYATARVKFQFFGRVTTWPLYNDIRIGVPAQRAVLYNRLELLSSRPVILVRGKRRLRTSDFLFYENAWTCTTVV